MNFRKLYLRIILIGIIIASFLISISCFTIGYVMPYYYENQALELLKNERKILDSNIDNLVPYNYQNSDNGNNNLVLTLVTDKNNNAIFEMSKYYNLNHKTMDLYKIAFFRNLYVASTYSNNYVYNGPDFYSKNTDKKIDDIITAIAGKPEMHSSFSFNMNVFQDKHSDVLHFDERVGYIYKNTYNSDNGGFNLCGYFHIDSSIKRDDREYLQKLADESEGKLIIRFKHYIQDGMQFYPTELYVFGDNGMYKKIVCYNTKTGNVLENKDYYYIYGVENISWIESKEQAEIKHFNKKQLNEINKYSDDSKDFTSFQLGNKVIVGSYVNSPGADYIISVSADFEKNYIRIIGFVVLTIILITILIVSLLCIFRYKEMKKISYQINLNNALAHDINSMLMVLSGFSETLTVTKNEEKKIYYAGEIRRSSMVIKKMVNQMLNYSRINSSKKAFKTEEVDLHLASIAAWNKYESESVDKNLTLSINGEGSAKCDPFLMEMVIDNFIDNAIKYGVENTEITIDICENEYRIKNKWIPVKDIIDNPNLLWEAYEKGNKARTSPKGAGLGLSISKSIFEMYRYKYSVKTEEDSITFSFKYKK